MAADSISTDSNGNSLHTNPKAGNAGHYRWTICALLFFATTINYLDRAVLSLLGPTIKDLFVVNMVTGERLTKDFPQIQGAESEAVKTEVIRYTKLNATERKDYVPPANVAPVWDRFTRESEQQFARVNMAFTASYAIGLISAGRIIDWMGTRLGLSLSVLLWSIAGMAHAFARGFTGFFTARLALGLTEAGNFPASVKTVAEWFPKKERALATGIFNAGSNVGAVLAPAMVPWLALTYGWKESFVVTGAFGFVWLFFWILIYRRPQEHRKVGAAELAYIQSDPPDPTYKVRWSKLLPLRQTWAFSIGKLLTDPIWWFFLFWTPSFFQEHFGYGLAKISLPMIVIYLAADIGSIGGGWISSSLIKRGWSVNKARKTAMLICAICVVPVFFAGMTKNPWVAVAVISLALGAHQGWSCNLFTLVSDTFPRFAVGSVVGIGGMVGALGGLFMSEVVGQILKNAVTVKGETAYMPMFLAASGMYLLTLLIIHLLVPRLQPANLNPDNAS